MLANGSPYHTPIDGQRYFEDHKCHVFLAWLSTRVLRGGPRLLLQATACILAVYLVSCTLPQRATDIGYGALLKLAGGAHVVDDGSVAGGLRIVVFGTSDMATIPDDEDFTGETTWAEVMCTELDCSTYISLAPKAPSRALASNSLYASAILPSADADPEKQVAPGLDYSFYPEMFPVEWSVPDFSNQVTEFLSRPRPQLLPRETLWVFNFGHWDVWNLAALPLKTSQPLIGAIVADVIENIEKLYRAAMDSKSIAHSDFLLVNDTISMSSGAGQAERDRADPMVEKLESQEKETFRIVVPMIFDQTLAPGWKTERPDLPAAHSKAEQHRNAATLTDLWNVQLQRAIEDWIKKENPKDEAQPAADTQEGGGQKERNEPKPLSLRADETGAGASQPAVANDTPLFRMISRSSADGQQKQQSPPPLAKVYPVRDAIIYDLQEYLTEIMVERQLRNVQYVDQNGLGGKPEAEGFRNVQTPCVRRAVKAPPPPSPESRSKGDSKSQDDGYKQDRTPSLSMRTTKRGESSNREAGKEPARKATGHRNASDEVCDNPREHLFYTALTLSPRAVQEMGREIAELVIKNHTLRSYWEQQSAGNQH